MEKTNDHVPTVSNTMGTAEKKRALLAEKLIHFRERERELLDAAYFEDKVAFAILEVWPEVEKEWKHPKPHPPHAPDRLWEWLWSGVWFDRLQLAERVGCTERIADTKLRLLARERSIYPDGTICEEGKLLINDHLNFKRKQRRKQTRKK